MSIWHAARFRSTPGTVASLLFVLGATMLLALSNPSAAHAQSVKTLKSGDCDNGCTVPAGEVWQFPPSASLTISSDANVVVYGTLRMKPANGNVEHVLKFTGIDEDAFVGGGASVVASDVGLWVMGSGKLDIVGTEKVAWSTKWESGWKASDIIKAAPNTKGDYTTWKEVNSAADVPPANPLGYKTELLNLTRNVEIKGTASGKTHVFIHSSSKQTVKNVTLRYMAPDFLANDDKTGRYGLHFHLNADGSRGSVVDGVVVRDADGHAFVPHGSHGVKFQDTIAFDTTGEAYWWDESTGDSCPDGTDCNATDDTDYFCTIAARTRSHSSSPHESAAFQMGAGVDNTIRDSVAVGMLGDGQNNSGYKWPSKDHGVWVFEDNIAHNNDANGIFVWQNSTGTDADNHLVEKFDAYYNKKAGIDHGAYHNSYQYENLELRGNGVAIESHALGLPSSDDDDATQIWNRISAEGQEFTAMLHNVLNDKAKPAQFYNCDFGSVVFNEKGEKGGGKRGLYDFVNCGLSPSDLDLSNADPGTVIRLQKLNGTATRVTGTGSTSSIGAFTTAGNYRYQEISPSGALGSRIRGGYSYTPGLEALVTPDIDGDGDSELVLYDKFDGGAQIYELNSNGTKGPLIRNASWGANWTSVATPDIDGDGDHELLLYKSGSGVFKYYELHPDGKRTLIKSGTWAKGWSSVATPELDGDGDDELLLYNRSTGAFQYHELTKKASLGRLIRSGTYGKWWNVQATPDVDGDGDDELVRYKKNKGRYQLRELTTSAKLGKKKKNTTTAKGWDSIAAPDVDGDGDDELLLYR